MSELDDYIAEHQRKNERWDAASAIVSVLALLAVLCVGVFVEFNGCQVHDDAAIHALESQGLSDAKLGGPGMGDCSRGETSRGFTATNTAGKRVVGTVCCGMFMKSCTVRW